MLRRHHRFFQSVQVIRDLALVAAAFALAYAVRFSFPEILPYETLSDPRETLVVSIILTLVWPLVGWMSGLYVSRRTHGVLAEVLDVFRVTLVSFLVVVTFTYFAREVRFSRATLILWVAFAIVLISVARVASRVFLRTLRSRGYNLRHVVVVGSGPLANQVVDTIHREAALGLRVVGLVHDEPEAEAPADAPVLGGVADLGRIVQGHDIDQVLVALPIEKLGALKGIMAVLSQETVDVRLIPDFYQFMTLCGSVEEFSGLPIINLQSTPLMGWNLVSKRVFDVAVAALGLLLVSPIFGLVALAVRLSSRGPIFFHQERVGMDGSRFTMIKFRTMRLDAESKARWTSANDPRRTAIGSFLRKLSLDELPQLWNVLRGDMSLVGPRPEQPAFIEDFKKAIPRYALRHKIKAGMTGWAQVHGMRGNTSIAKRIELDLYYIENWSLLLDVKILVRTVFGGFMSPNAY